MLILLGIEITLFSLAISLTYLLKKLKKQISFTIPKELKILVIESFLGFSLAYQFEAFIIYSE